MVVKIRPLIDQDIERVVCSLREADRREIEAASGDVSAAVFDTVRRSDVAMTVDDGEPIALFGVASNGVVGGGVPWLIGTDGLARHKKEFLQRSRCYFAEMLKEYGTLENYVDIRNKQSIRWLRWLGFSFDQPKPYGVQQRPFCRFYGGV